MVSDHTQVDMTKDMSNSCLVRSARCKLEAFIIEQSYSHGTWFLAKAVDIITKTYNLNVTVSRDGGAESVNKDSS